MPRSVVSVLEIVQTLRTVAVKALDEEVAGLVAVHEPMPLGTRRRMMLVKDAEEEVADCAPGAAAQWHALGKRWDEIFAREQRRCAARDQPLPPDALGGSDDSFVRAVWAMQEEREDRDDAKSTASQATLRTEQAAEAWRHRHGFPEDGSDDAYDAAEVGEQP